MDFFERQDKARKNTKLLVFYFALAVTCIMAAVYFACLVIFAGASAKARRYGIGPELALWNPQILLFAAIGTLGVVTFGSLYKISALSRGGPAVAESLGGRLVNPDTRDADERKLRNVVEEMALASGVPVPQVYVMDGESGINAFAAGHSPSDAAVCVTSGCMKLLKRDELQGVIGHEFSHILNGDMRLNLRLMGVIFGILCLAIIGRILLRTRGRKNPLPLLGLALIIIGWVGVFFGNLIQAAVSRQREFLADASAVQFTRNPIGLSGALQKIGGLPQGSRVEAEHAAEASHMFFGNAVSGSFFNLFATHPPIEERIRAIDPSWDGKFPRVTTAEEAPELITAKDNRGFRDLVGALAAAGAPQARTPVSRVPPKIPMATVLPTVGQPTPRHLRYAEELRSSLPESVRAAARDPLAAVALIYAMLLSPDEIVRATQLAGLAKRTAPKISEKTVVLLPEVTPIAERARLPLVNLALTALRQLRSDEFKQFSQTLRWLIESDQQIDLFEFVLQKIIRRHLELQFNQTRPPANQYYTIKPLVPDCCVVLSALANLGSADAAEVEKAFLAGAPHVRSPEGEWQLLSREACGLAEIDTALNRLALAVPQIKKNLLDACIHVVGADGVIQEREAELLRAIADTLDCPIPPFLESKEDASMAAS